MVKLDVSMWNSKNRMRETIKRFATSLMSMSAMNGIFCFTQEQYFLMGINIFVFVLQIPTFVTYTQWKKRPPEPGDI